METSPRSCWVVTDGRAGNRAQALALAEAMARLESLTVVEKQIVTGILPFLAEPSRRLKRGGDRLDPPYPDVWIGCGRASVPLSIALKKRNPATFVVQLQNPRAPLEKFDLVIAPAHDALVGGNVVSMVGAPNRVGAARAGGARAVRNVAVLIGGPNRAFRFGAKEARRLVAEIGALRDVELSITTSRRTSPTVADALESALKAKRFWRADRDGAAANPYPAMLAEADAILVTEDSVNMAAEAAATGKPVYILKLPRKTFASSRKFDAFHESLRAHGAARLFEGRVERWNYEPLNETARVAEEAVRRWRDFRSRPRVR